MKLKSVNEAGHFTVDTEFWGKTEYYSNIKTMALKPIFLKLKKQGNSRYIFVRDGMSAAWHTFIKDIL